MASFEILKDDLPRQIALDRSLVGPSRNRLPRPFLKWAGGKGQILDDLLARLSALPHFKTYHEPFLGGAALYFELSRTGRLTGQARLSDLNHNLIAAYTAVRDFLPDLTQLLRTHQESHSETFYYEMRSRRPTAGTDMAARLIYLNKTCYNGLYRENSKGDFNVPFGRYTNPQICDELNLAAASSALAPANLAVAPFEDVLEHAEPGDLVYFDPPYDPLSATSSFTAYSGDGFRQRDQSRLAGVFRDLDRGGVYVMASNSLTPLVSSLYSGYSFTQVLARRAVNSRAAGRGKIPELVITNFD